jgi:hypothetical protein
MTCCLILAAKGKKGHARQAVAVARRIGCEIAVRETGGERDCVPETGDVALVLAAGRQSIAPARRIATRPAPRPLVAVLQPVFWRPRQFDLVWAPLHDRHLAPFARRTRIETLTAPSAVCPADRRAGASVLAERIAGLPRPLVGVLVGGPSRSHRFGTAEAEEFAARLAALASAWEAGLVVTTSRRTGPVVTAILRERLSTAPHVLVDAAEPDGGLDPSLAYAGILEVADHLVVTADSFAMLSDAATTGKPIHGWRLPGGRAKFERFYAGLADHGALRWFDGSLPAWSYPPLDAAAVVAEALTTRLRAAGLPGGTPGRM